MNPESRKNAESISAEEKPNKSTMTGQASSQEYEQRPNGSTNDSKSAHRPETLEPSLGPSVQQSAQRRSVHGGSTSTALVSSSKEIAKMVEPSLLTAQELQAQKIIYPQMADTRTVDLYRELRTKLLYRSNGENKITLVTSVLPGGGSTHVALNLAAAFAFDQTKTALIIDCNLRKPALHTLLSLEPQIGLTDFLERQMVGLDNIIYATGIERLRLIPAGSSREVATEYFTSMRMKALLDVLQKRYSDRHLFIDAPSITEAADTRILAELCDQVLLVVPYGKAANEHIAQALDAIGEDKIVGVVVNNG